MEECITSALSLGRAAIEVIVVDDGSTDGSWTVISAYEDRVRAIHTPNRGSVAACLTGFAAARGAYVLFLDADDLIGPEAFDAFAPHLDGRIAKVQFCLQPIDAAGRPISRPFPVYPAAFDTEAIKRTIWRHGCYATPPTSANVYRRDVYENVGDIGYDWGIDGVAYLIAPFMGEVITLRETLGSYRIHGSNMTSVKKITAARMEREGRVFGLRVAHLAAWLRGRGDDASRLAPDGSYLYCVERAIYAAILSGRRPALHDMQAYWSAIWREGRGPAKLAHLGYAGALLILPPSVARQLIMGRIDSGFAPRLRELFKRRVA